MATKTRDDELAGQAADSRPSDGTTQRSERLANGDPSFTMPAVLFSLALLGYMVVGDIVPFWIWLTLPATGIAIQTAMLMKMRNASVRRVADGGGHRQPTPQPENMRHIKLKLL